MIYHKLSPDYQIFSMNKKIDEDIYTLRIICITQRVHFNYMDDEFTKYGITTSFHYRIPKFLHIETIHLVAHLRLPRMIYTSKKIYWQKSVYRERSAFGKTFGGSHAEHADFNSKHNVTTQNAGKNNPPKILLDLNLLFKFIRSFKSAE